MRDVQRMHRVAIDPVYRFRYTVSETSGGGVPCNIRTLIALQHAETLPIFRQQGYGHILNIASTAGHKTVPNQAVYSGTEFAVGAISDGLRQEAGPDVRVTVISPGITDTDFAAGIIDPKIKRCLEEIRDQMAMPPEAVARAIVFAIEQPAEVNVGEIVISPSAQA
ncbi:SDR family oxidoreductase [Saccharibacillus deserti]|uniref:SDR family oxidoreductase n=1 Tax=Saccharibacillus deserti TaxID=1634444 RepID=UPI0015542CD8|nr:SDR family NAD(P)-dependent oxidoreductase [Saccharibacillus deserti]